ncbi:MAG: hypothetical protein MUC77_14315 [Chromatiaceae bacterium]|nr:hypothetical protein [Chromatiaceae bacterium]
MKLCRECGRSPWPFLMAFFVAGLCTFITWLTLTYSQFDTIERMAGSLLVFVLVGGTLVHYVLSCIRRHCRHEKPGGHPHR